MVAAKAQGPREEQGQHGPQAFSAGVHDVTGHGADQGRQGVDFGLDGGVDGRKFFQEGDFKLGDGVVHAWVRNVCRMSRASCPRGPMFRLWSFT